MKTTTNFRLLSVAFAIFAIALISSRSATAQVNSAVSDVVDEMIEQTFSTTIDLDDIEGLSQAGY
jgi:hypothetical protein